MAVVEYFYSAHSAYAYLGAARLYEICAAHGARLIHKPFDLSPVVEAQGSLPFRARTQAHVDYFFGREIERWAEWRGVDIISFRPTHHDADYALAGRMIAALGEDGPQVDRLSLAILRAHWRDDADISDVGVLFDLAQSEGLAPQALFSRANSAEIRARYQANTAEATQKPVFGSPTYIVDGDPFYGQDRLKLVDYALTQPFAPAAWQNPLVDP